MATDVILYNGSSRLIEVVEYCRKEVINNESFELKSFFDGEIVDYNIIGKIPRKSISDFLKFDITIYKLFPKSFLYKKPFKRRYEDIDCQEGEWVMLWLNGEVVPYSDELEIIGRSDLSYKNSHNGLETIGDYILKAKPDTEAVFELVSYLQNSEQTKRREIIIKFNIL